MNTLLKFAVFLLAGLMLAACEPGGAPTAGGAGRIELAQGQNTYDSGEYVFLVNAITTDTLPPEVARANSIARSNSRVMLNVVMMKKAEVGLNTAVTGVVETQTTNLAGQLKTMPMRQIAEAGGPNSHDAIYYIGEIPISQGETLIFDVDATPDGETDAVRLRFRRQFFTR